MRDDCVHEDLSPGIYYCSTHKTLCVMVKENADSLGICVRNNKRARAVLVSAYMTVRDERPDLEVAILAVEWPDGNRKTYAGEDMEAYVANFRS